MDPSPVNPSESIAIANPTSEVESSTVPGVKGDIVDTKETALDAEPKTQAEVESTLGGQSSVTSDVGGLLASVGQTAYSYLPDSLKNLNVKDATDQASATASNTATTVAETTSGAVAAAVAAVSPGGVNKHAESMPSEAPNTLPSQDKEGQLPLSAPMDGVGALPGKADEQNVALLPDEKNAETMAPQVPTESAVTSPSTVASNATAAVTGAVGAVTATVAAGATAAYTKATEAYSAADPTAGVVPEGTTTTTKPSEETTGAETETGGPVGGAGSLPGKSTEEGVALLPDEKANPNPLITASDEYAKAKTNAAIANPYEGGLKGENETPKSKTAAAVDTAKEKVEKVTTSNSMAESESAASSTPSKKKVSMGDKLKGQMKIISGKMTSDSAKVEAGRALKSGN